MNLLTMEQVHEEFPEKFEDLLNHDNYDVQHAARKAWWIITERDDRIKDINTGDRMLEFLILHDYHN